MAVSTNNGLVNGPMHNVLMRFSTLGSSKIEVFEITSRRLFDQSQEGVYRGKRHIPLILGFLGAIRVPYPTALNFWFNPLKNHYFFR